MSEQPKYLLDADTFIRAKREHYAFDFCPGFWEALLRSHRQSRLRSIDPIRRELVRGKDALAIWVRKEAPESLFESVEDPNVDTAYRRVITWVEGNDQYSRAAKQRFIGGADPWLIAAASAWSFVLVTYEVSAQESKAIIKLPDVARQFGVTFIPPYVMLRKLKVVLALQK